MQQHEFIWMAKNLKVTDVTQDETGNTVINLRPQIQLTHNYKKKNQMQIVFTEDQSRFLIPSKSDLEEIFRLHLSNVNVEQILRKHCEDNFEKV